MKSAQASSRHGTITGSSASKRARSSATRRSRRIRISMARSSRLASSTTRGRALSNSLTRGQSSIRSTSAGLIAGLWLTPFAWDSKLPLFEGKQDWFVKKPEGNVYEVKWAGDCLDMTNPEARKFLADVIHRITNDWGYKLLKLDGLWSG